MTFDDISDIIQHASSIVVYVIAIGSLLDAASPPPLPKDDPDNSTKGKWRKTKTYKIYYKIVGFCAANIGWAKNLASPKALGIVGNIVKGVANQQALNNLANEADAAVKENNPTKDMNAEQKDDLKDQINTTVKRIDNDTPKNS